MGNNLYGGLAFKSKSKDHSICKLMRNPGQGWWPVTTKWISEEAGVRPLLSVVNRKHNLVVSAEHLEEDRVSQAGVIPDPSLKPSVLTEVKKQPHLLGRINHSRIEYHYKDFTSNFCSAIHY